LGTTAELIKKEELKLNLNIFATDIDESALKKAQEGAYTFESIKNVKYRLLKKHFTIKDESYLLNPEIKELVKFSFYDMLDKKTYVPPESVFGNFDLVLCRNVLIYFQTEHQEIIFDKLVRSLAVNGHLVLGEAEMLPLKYQRCFQKENEYCHIYRKN
jgi:chemotaxis protein methyltransferase CheR